MRLRRMPVGGLKRNEPCVDAVAFKAMREPAVRLPGCDGEQPAVVLERIEQFENAVEQRLLNLSGPAQLPEGTLVILGEREVLGRGGIGQKRRHRLGKAEADYLARNLRRREL